MLCLSSGFGVPLVPCRWPRLLATYPNNLYMPLLRLVFDTVEGMGLNMVRYQIPAGYNPSLSPAVAASNLQAQGFKVDPNAPYNWSSDGAQIRVLKDAKLFGVNVFEAVSYSPPWWMTKSGTVQYSTVLSLYQVKYNTVYYSTVTVLSFL